MKRLWATMIGALMLTTPMLTIEPAAGASVVTPNAIPGTYSLHYNYGTGYYAVSMTLSGGHKGTDSFGDTITWSVTGRAFTMVLTNPVHDPGITATYLGKKNRNGISTLSKPGTMSSNVPASGIWYAVKTG